MQTVCQLYMMHASGMETENGVCTFISLWKDLDTFRTQEGSKVMFTYSGRR